MEVHKIEIEFEVTYLAVKLEGTGDWRRRKERIKTIGSQCLIHWQVSNKKAKYEGKFDTADLWNDKWTQDGILTYLLAYLLIYLLA